MLKVIKYLFLVLLMPLAGCTTTRYNYDPTNTIRTQSVPRELLQSITIEKETLRFEEKKIASECDYDLYDVSIFKDNTVITSLRWYRSKRAKKNPRPVDFIWPILAGKKMIVANLYAANIFAPIGVDSIIIRQNGKLFKTNPPRMPKDFIDFNQETVRSLLRARRWAEQKSFFDKKRFGITGTSYGGILATVCIPFTRDFASHKIIMAGGGIPEILNSSVEVRVVRWRKALLQQIAQKIRDERTPQLQADYYNNLDAYEKKITEDAFVEMQERFQKIEKWDPFHFAQYAEPETTAMIVTLCDNHVPSANQKRLWKKLGRPETLFVNSGHFTLALAYFQVKSFLKEMATKHYGLDRS
ncbi:alpha/beta hydrolase family protein [Candidatus Uabimicrobium amorphum]|uniref:Alpha/beta hydrolase n=1 Tax=Uabimicrobium amorphum TaxID=2596890 RepID=A0A5S9IKM2_UABAM|nr:alpha/beta hydrolase [Candidatus Uabimicrobium amorphum]BBM83609.1 alpha/beta hydrolase [Candidatus Uabimicrobium amorphum]